MQKWEIFRLDVVVAGKNILAQVAVLLTPGGDKIIKQTVGYRENDYAKAREQCDQLIALLGLDGWEPMPIVTTAGSMSSNIIWYFKRPVS